MDESNQATSAEITQAVADSNAATVASLSTSISGTEANAGAVSASADAASLSTSTVASQETGGAAAAAPDTSSITDQSAPTTAAASSSGSADATLADAGGIPAPSLTAVPPETLLALLHADLEALERKIELGIHVFAHEVAAIRDQVKSLI
ncbi:hypothetical protein [Burkholderia gladioli]|uniref:hypothetical protein n=1 Tax=Burkholderia gladioli TaxID=28095 RepID=UPI0016414E75|nr:hypothetical protein [Burkholderia gladioli]